eukprot:CAMPEP_0183315620 /NCGR_PEP_ID=MMETSP0160_2-20130417/52375_1 /TAXON_ID=2839 ORGANISM="Odontella Sinensis, Strain Grunow 1884" /NCGR_SAMPLE_ID=MMETSP0160_2 /ASSEMBLY_ACC=CAM_ASM_000250 /LENGTH=293 /DNA_ID=CAMNT_0025481227 /DNA_START=191 /DNA_END=1068 /DNA_ORIENTATION=+
MTQPEGSCSDKVVASVGSKGRSEEKAEANDDQSIEEHYDMRPSETRVFMKDKCTRDGDARYAIKRLKPNAHPGERIAAMLDLARECKILATIHHSNIIKMRGMATGDPLRPNFFFILDRLYDTLEERIDVWKEEEKNFKSCLPCFGQDQHAMDLMRYDRIRAAYDIASAYRHLHSHKLIYRDIKPANIGFDVRSDVKVFDFGLARDISDCEQTKDGLYKMTGNIGSYRYMAAEVFLCLPYNLSADVYSYGILLWQIMALDTPFKDMAQDDMHKTLMGRNLPLVPKTWPIMIVS